MRNMKKASFFLALIIILGLFVSCEGIGNKPPADTTKPSSDSAEAPADTTEPSGIGNEYDFSFSYEMERTEYTRGETVKIKATVTNSSGEDYIYTGSSTAFFPSVSLYWMQNGNENGGIIEHDPIAITDDYVKMTIKPGESGSRVYSFRIPEDAVCTDYSITLSFGGDSKEFLGVLQIVEPAALSVSSFSFSKEAEIYKENDPGVKSDGFKNVSNVEIKTQADAADRAKNECTIAYDSADVSFDPAEKVWKIVFNTQGFPGGCQTVYLDSNGMTLLIVYGE